MRDREPRGDRRGRGASPPRSWEGFSASPLLLRTFQEARGPPPDGPGVDARGRASPAAGPAERPPGSLTSLVGWVARHSRGLGGKARAASQHLHGGLSSLGRRMARNPPDSFFLCQLLAFGVPFLYGLSEVLLQIGAELPCRL